jgi:hypothetical protein
MYVLLFPHHHAHDHVFRHAYVLFHHRPPPIVVFLL